MRWSVVLLAFVVTLPTLYSALWVQDVPVDSAVIHFLIAVPILAVLDAVVRMAAKPSLDKRASRSANASSEAAD
jgi:heme A synthase